jgi:hypothetical protein
MPLKWAYELLPCLFDFPPSSCDFSFVLLLLFKGMGFVLTQAHLLPNSPSAALQ